MFYLCYRDTDYSFSFIGRSKFMCSLGERFYFLSVIVLHIEMKQINREQHPTITRFVDAWNHSERFSVWVPKKSFFAESDVGIFINGYLDLINCFFWFWNYIIYIFSSFTLEVMMHVFLPYVIILIGGVLATALVTLSERKGLAGVQRRQGPAVVGPFGILQPIADAVKLLFKQEFGITLATAFLYRLAPLITFVIPFSLIFFLPIVIVKCWSDSIDMSFGILFIMALFTLKIFGVLFAGWASNSKYALLGSVRTASQLVSYDLVFGLCFLVVGYKAGSFSIGAIIEDQMLNWNLVTLMPFAVLFYISMLAEGNRSPFDNLEAESEVVSGYNTDYLSISFAMFFLGEYGSLLVLSCLFTMLFLGGSISSLSGGFVYLFFFLKMFIIVGSQVLLRGTLPRERYDKLMFLGWKYLLPLTFILFLIVLGIRIF